MYRTAVTIQDQLLERCKQGDAVSCEILYNQYASAMYNTSFRILNNAADAEDILQDAFISAFQKLATFENRSSFGSWLKRIVINASINKLKRQKRNWVTVEFIDQQPFDKEEQDSEQELQFKITEVKKAIQELPDGYRTVLCLYLLEEHSHEEISVLLKISPNTVRSQYIRAKKKLVEIIKKRAVI